MTLTQSDLLSQGLEEKEHPVGRAMGIRGFFLLLTILL
jgi:hypothetical protein